MSTQERENNSIFTAERAKRSGFEARDVMKDDFGFEVPTEAIPLPSGGRVYPVESSLHSSEFVEITAMTAKEEDILTSRALIKKGTVITQLIKSCMVDKSINVDEMISGDRNAIMTALRITGYGSSYEATVDCPACGEKSKQEFKLNELPVKDLNIAPVAEGVNLFEYELPITKKKVHFKFLTGTDEQEIIVLQERKKKQGMQDNLVTTRLQYSIVAVDGIKDRNKITTFSRNMPARDSLALRKFIDDNEPGIDMKQWMTCPHCDEHSEVRLPMGASFFGLTPDDKEFYLEQIFILMYYMGFLYKEAYHLPVWQRTWFIQRINKEFQRANDRNANASRAAHDNTPDRRAYQGMARESPPARLRRFT